MRCVPAFVVASREQVASMLLERVEEEVSEDRIKEERDELGTLVDVLLAADIDLKLTVKLLGGRRPMKEMRAGSYDGQIGRRRALGRDDGRHGTG
eukprot:1867063-Pleurochrysis_carterae.AAC.2